MTLQVQQLTASLSPCANSKKTAASYQTPYVQNYQGPAVWWPYSGLSLCHSAICLLGLVCISCQWWRALPSHLSPPRSSRPITWTKIFRLLIIFLQVIPIPHNLPEPVICRANFPGFSFLSSCIFCRWRLCVFSPKSKFVLFHLSSSDEAKILMNCRLRKLL